jgi:hypothetical protein
MFFKLKKKSTESNEVDARCKARHHCDVDNDVHADLDFEEIHTNTDHDQSIFKLKNLRPLSSSTPIPVAKDFESESKISLPTDSAKANDKRYRSYSKSNNNESSKNLESNDSPLLVETFKNLILEMYYGLQPQPPPQQPQSPDLLSSYQKPKSRPVPVYFTRRPRQQNEQSVSKQRSLSSFKSFGNASSIQNKSVASFKSGRQMSKYNFTNNNNISNELNYQKFNKLTPRSPGASNQPIEYFSNRKNPYLFNNNLLKQSVDPQLFYNQHNRERQFIAAIQSQPITERVPYGFPYKRRSHIQESLGQNYSNYHRSLYAM